MTSTPPNAAERKTADALGSYAQFVARIDAHAARVEAAWGEQLACARGCSGCCHRTLTVFPIEAARIRAHLGGQTLPAAPPPPLTPRSLAVLDLDGAVPCAMLDAQGDCRIYEVRPLICRSHGLPLAIEDDDGVYGDVCPLSFDGGQGLAELPSADFLALSTLNTVLVALNQQFVTASGAAESRISLTALAAGE